MGDAQGSGLAGVRGQVQRFRHACRKHARGSPRHDHAAHALRVVHVGDACDEMAKRMADQHRAATAQCLNGIDHISRKAVQCERLEGQRGAPHATRLGSQYAVTEQRQLLRQGVEIQRIALRRRQQNDGRARTVLGSVDHDIDLARTGADHLTAAQHCRWGHGVHGVNPPSRRTVGRCCATWGSRCAPAGRTPPGCWRWARCRVG